MGVIQTIERQGRPLDHREEVSHPEGVIASLINLSTWIILLGSVRLALAAADGLLAGLDAVRNEPMSIQRWATFFRDNPPIAVLVALWPPFLGLALRRTRWPELLKVAALTFLILSVGGMLSLIADWGDHRANWLAVGSFSLSRHALAALGWPFIAVGLLGLTQLLFELWTAVRAIVLALRMPAASLVDSDPDELVKRSRFGLLGICISMIFLIMTVRLPASSAFYEVLNQSRFIREFLLRDDLRRVRSLRSYSPPTPEAMRIQEIQILLQEASQASESGRYSEALNAYQRLLVMADSIPPSSLTTQGRHSVAHVFNGLAWLLATCPDASLRNPHDAVIYAKRATELLPNDRAIWNTLGVSYYRLGNWEEARSALYRSMEISDEGDSFDWFFLAMIHAKFEHKERALEWYNKAVEWSHHYRPPPMDSELYQFQVEAAEVLGLPKPERAPTPAQTRLPRAPTNSFGPRAIPRGRRGAMLDLPARENPGPEMGPRTRDSRLFMAIA